MRIFYFILSFFLTLPLFSQPYDEDTVGVIYIGHNEVTKPKILDVSPIPTKATPPSLPLPEKVCIQYPQDNVNGTFMRNMCIYRLDLNLFSNIWLKQTLYTATLFDNEAEKTNKLKRGLIPAIIKGIQTEKIIALSPKNTEYRYTYTDFIHDLERFEAKNGDTIVAEPDTNSLNPFNEFGVKIEEKKSVTQNLSFYSQYVNQMVDFVIEKGINSHDLREYFRIRYVQLLWYNPAISPQPKIMAIIPYHLLEPYLAQMKVHDVEHASGEFSVKQYLEMGNFNGQIIEIR